MKNGTFKFFALCCLAGWMSGCASIDSRIEDQQSYFDTLPVETQEKIRAGNLDIGFDGTMVEMAWGRPSAVKQRITAEAKSEIWIYRDTKTEFVYPNYSLMYATRHHYSRRGRCLPYHHYGPTTRSKEYEAARVVFVGGKVKEIEALSK